MVNFKGSSEGLEPSAECNGVHVVACDVFYNMKNELLVVKLKVT